MKFKAFCLLRVLTISLCVSTGEAYSQGCPTDIPDNSSLNFDANGQPTGQPVAWAGNAQITAWIDTSQIPEGRASITA